LDAAWAKHAPVESVVGAPIVPSAARVVRVITPGVGLGGRWLAMNDAPSPGSGTSACSSPTPSRTCSFPKPPTGERSTTARPFVYCRDAPQRERATTAVPSARTATFGRPPPGAENGTFSTAPKRVSPGSRYDASIRWLPWPQPRIAAPAGFTASATWNAKPFATSRCGSSNRAPGRRVAT
jgi:hypothetical protein